MFDLTIFFGAYINRHRLGGRAFGRGRLKNLWGVKFTRFGVTTHYLTRHCLYQVTYYVMDVPHALYTYTRAQILFLAETRKLPVHPWA